MDLPLKTMFRWITLVVLVTLTACQTATGLTPTLAPTESPTPNEVTQVSADGVTLAIQTPHGWQSVPNDYGILLAEHAELYGSGTPDGILVYIFVPKMEDMPVDDHDDNLALAVLDHVTKLPAYVGDSTVTSAMPMRLGSHNAAYYLLSDADDNRTLVLALNDPATNKIVVCNVSSSRRDSVRIRSILPTVLANLTIDGQAIVLEGLDALPDPLVFPVHRREADDEATPDATEDAVSASPG